MQKMLPLAVRQSPLLRLALALWLVGSVGCSGNTVQRASVEGTVTFEGKPVETGMILFAPEPGVVGPAVQVVITNGEFASPKVAGPAIGMNVVQIFATRKTGRILTIEGQKSEETVQYIPARYNEKSTEKVEIKSGVNQFDFHLTEK